MNSSQEIFLSDEQNLGASAKLLHSSVYVVFALHFSIFTSALFSNSLSGFWLGLNIVLGIIISLVVLFKHIRQQYLLCSIILILVTFSDFVSLLGTSLETASAVLIAPLMPLMTLFLLGKKYAWGILAIEALILIFWHVSGFPNNQLTGNLWDLRGPYILGLIISLCALVISQIYVNLNNQLKAQLHVFASQDYLTGVLNRHALDVQLEKSGKSAESQKKPLAVILADIDFFKNLNDEHGHLVGDWCLEQIGKSFSVEIERLQKRASVGRYGGEEFVIILPECNSMEDAKSIAEAMRLAAGAAGSSAVPGDTVTLTMGMAFTNTVTADVDADRLLESADIALYQGKNTGRDKLVCLKV